MKLKQKILLLIIRISKFFRKEEELMPHLNSVPERGIKYGHLYRHYGRILVAYKNKAEPQIKFFKSTTFGAKSVHGHAAIDPASVSWEECTEAEYQEALKNPAQLAKCEKTGSPCEMCACNQLGLPCHCMFPDGLMTGYFKVIKQERQYSDNITI